MIFPLCLFIAAIFPASSTNQRAQSTPPSQPTSTKIYEKEPKTLAEALSSLRSNIDEDENQLMSDLFDSSSSAQQGITPYTAMPASPHTVNQALYASKAWFAGPRDTLNQHGIGFSATYTSVIEGDPVGGVHPKQSDYFDNITLTSIIDTEKLLGWHGGYFIMSAAQQDGSSISWKNVGNQFNVGSAAGGVTMKWVQLFYQQNFFNDHANLDVGRMCAMNEFDVSPILWNYIGTFQAFQSGIQSTFNPNASWGSRLKVNVTHDTDFRFGIFQITQPSDNGLVWNFYPTDTYVLFSQYSWNPEFNTPDISSAFSSLFNIGKKKSSVPSQDEVTVDPNTPADTQEKKLAGHYFVGGFYNGAYGGVLPAQYNTQNTGGARLPDNYAFYCHGDQVVYRPNPLLDSGLTLWSEFSYAPQTTVFPITFQASGGAIYTGLIPGRKSDFTIFGLNYGRWSMNAASADQYWSNRNGLGNNIYPTYEFNTELGYRINLTRFCFVQPDIQFIVNPGGTGHVPNSLVLGTEIGVNF